MAFSVGDTVRCVKDYPDDNEFIFTGCTGTVVIIEEGRLPVGVRWDHCFETGHDCSGYCDFGHGWFVNECDIELVAEGVVIDVSASDIDDLLAEVS